MKKIYLLVAVALMLTASFVYAEPAETRCDQFYTGTVAAGTTVYSNAIDLVRRAGYEGFFSIQPTYTGTGVLKIDYQTNNGGGWFAANVVQITATTTTGKLYWLPASGVNMFSGSYRFAFTETGTANPVDITGLNLCSE